MEPWRKQLEVDPIPALLASGGEALAYLTRRDLLQEPVGSIRALWELPEPQKILRKQQADGSWSYPSKKAHDAINYSLIETWKQYRILIQKYEFDRSDPAIERASEFLFACQTPEGDIRGMLANQYATYYTGAILGLLIQAGYQDDARIEKGFQWLLSMRQQDCGWSIPLLTNYLDQETRYRLTSQYAAPVEPDRSQPFSHNWTGMVLRAFAAHPHYRRSVAARIAAGLLKSRFFESDHYTSYQAASYWVRFQYPFWWNNLAAALDSISLIDQALDEPMQRAVDWLIEHQRPDGLWSATYVQGKQVDNARSRETGFWVSLAICRVLARLFS